ncbi:MAG: FliM/FliN family flagellar motor switch protein [Acidobacteriaceae bacterium]|nr:FliM/FliN family flagellar motor switch protein [Acidobacteriaceae bacterium]MBV8572875.1 FliM/FliN family flagellar motor switch protein [Acidobacteriaceae bacterium]
MSTELAVIAGDRRASNAGSPLPALESFRPLHDVPLTICAELDRSDIPVRSLLALNVGSVLPLSRPAGENISLYAENVLLGTAEILVIHSALAVRIAELRDKAPDTEDAAAEINPVPSAT